MQNDFFEESKEYDDMIKWNVEKLKKRLENEKDMPPLDKGELILRLMLFRAEKCSLTQMKKLLSQGMITEEQYAIYQEINKNYPDSDDE